MPVKFRDYYETLGVAKTASDDDIRKAFRKLARQYHPDVAKGNKKGAEEKFKEINEAYEVLSDAEKRRRYDELGQDWQAPGGGGGGGGPFPGGGGFFRTRPGGGGGAGEYEFDGSTGFSDFFEQFFGAGARRGGGGAGFGFPGQQAAAAARGTDVEADLMVTLEEALAGGKRTVTLRRQDANGSPGGARPETIEVKIPAGVHGGQRIRLRGRGENGGDLYLRVRLARHPDFRVEENGDVYHDFALEAPRAVLGTEASVPTLEGGRGKLKIPAGSQPGQRFRLRGKGMPGPGGTRGDLYVQLDVQLPKALTPEQQKLWEGLAGGSE